MVGEGEARKNNGLRRVSESNLEWITAMREFAKNVAVERGSVCADDLRDYAVELARQGKTPTHPNAWGAIFRNKAFVSVGCVVSRYPGNHARPIYMWTLT